ncbi:MAG: extracellular solute-binding protein [Pseudomonadota bacterium]
MHGAPALAPGFANLPYAVPEAPKGGRMVFGEIGGFDSLNPYVLKGRAPWPIRSYTVESLMARSWDEPFTLYGLLAESIETPEDRSSVTFRLREGARFSDGSPVTVEDVLWSIETLGREGHPRYRAAWRAVARLQRIDARTLTVHFSEANRELPLILGLRPVLKKSQWQGRPFTGGLEAVTGSGPYVVDEAASEPGRVLVLRKNPDWWGADLPVNRGLYNHDEIRFEYFRNGDALWSAVQTGVVTVFSDNDPVRWAEGYDFAAAREGRVLRHEIEHARPSGMVGFVFNTRRAVFADRQVREALALSFDWTWINQRVYASAYDRIRSYWHGSALAFQGAAEGEEAALLAPFAAMLPPGTLEAGWRPPMGDGARNRRNLRTAARLLDEAGWTITEGQRQKNGEALTFEILVASTEHETLASLWRPALERLGVSLDIRRVDDAQYEARRQDYDYDMTVSRWYLSLSPGTEQRLYFGSEGREAPGTRNYAGIDDAAVDTMIAALLSAESQTRFEAAARALDRVLSAGIYVIPFGTLAQDRITAQASHRFPERAPLYGFRPETWWSVEAWSVEVD